MTPHQPQLHELLNELEHEIDHCTIVSQEWFVSKIEIPLCDTQLDYRIHFKMKKLIAALRVADESLKQIQGPSYGTELYNSDEENAEIIALLRDIFSNQTKAKEARSRIREIFEVQT